MTFRPLLEFATFAFICLCAVLLGATLCEQVSALDDNTTLVETRITLFNRTVYKGDWTYINGTIEDDQGQPVTGVPVEIIWKRPPEIGRVRSDAHGAFSLRYYVDYEARVGNVSVIARFDGDYLYMAHETTATWTVRGGTLLECRAQYVEPRLRPDVLRVSGSLNGDWSAFSGDGIGGETITLLINGAVIGSMDTTPEGSVRFTVTMDPERFGYGYAEVVLVFDGSEFYDGSRGVSEALIAFRGTFIYGPLHVDGRPFDPSLDVLRQGETVNGSVVALDAGNQPLGGTNVSAFYLGGGDRNRWALLGSGATNDQGIWEFDLILDYPSDGSLVLALGCRVPPNEGCPELTLRYIAPPPPTSSLVIEVSGDRTVEAGSNLRLEVKARDEEAWDTDRLTYRLVSPPEGMEISPEGVVTWRPGDEELGEHGVIVWLYDGSSSVTSVFKVTVVEARGGGSSMLLVALVVVILAIAVVVALVMLRRRG